MIAQDFTTTIIVEQTPLDVFNALNNVRGWWSEEIKGNTESLNDEFEYHYEDVHRCKIKIIASIPGKKVVWHVLDNYFKFTKDEKEWKDTYPTFEIEAVNEKTQLTFTHKGLVSAYECFEICRDAWTTYIQRSLSDLIVTGTGKPNGKGKPQTENEKKLVSD